MFKTIGMYLVLSCLFLNQAFAQERPLVVGMELQYPPFEMSETDGTPSGVSVDFAKALAKHLGRELKIENIAWDGLIPSLKTNKVDLIISSMTITDERQKTVDFSIPYAQSNLAILTNPSSGVKAIQDLNQKGKKIAVKKGTTGHLYATKYLQNAQLLVFDKENAAVIEVIQKKADGFLYDQLTIYKNWTKYKDTTIALLKPFQEHPEYWGVAIKKGNDSLKHQVDAFIRQAKSDGTFDQFSKKYLTEARATFDELGIPFFF